MTEWLREACDRFDGSRDVKPFAEFLIEQLNASARPREKAVVSGIHLGGFEEREGIRVPVFWFIRNARTFDAMKGVHSGLIDYYGDEQLLDHYFNKVPRPELRKTLRRVERASDFAFWLRNGDLQFATQT